MLEFSSPTKNFQSLIQATSQAAREYIEPARRYEFASNIEKLSKIDFNHECSEKDLQVLRNIISTLPEMISKIAGDLFLLSSFGICTRFKLKTSPRIDEILDTFEEVGKKISGLASSTMQFLNSKLPTNIHGGKATGFQLMHQRVIDGIFKVYFNNTPLRLLTPRSKKIFSDEVIPVVDKLKKAFSAQSDGNFQDSISRLWHAVPDEIDKNVQFIKEVFTPFYLGTMNGLKDILDFAIKLREILPEALNREFNSAIQEKFPNKSNPAKMSNLTLLGAESFRLTAPKATLKQEPI